MSKQVAEHHERAAWHHAVEAAKAPKIVAIHATILGLVWPQTALNSMLSWEPPSDDAQTK